MSGTEENMPDRRAGDKWRFNKEISILDLVTIVAAFASLAGVYMSIDKRLLVIETTFSSQRTLDQRLATERQLTRQELLEQRNELKHELGSIADKLDRLNMLLMRSYFEERTGKGKK